MTSSAHPRLPESLRAASAGEPFALSFAAAFAQLRRLVTGFAADGVLVAAVARGHVAAHAHIPLTGGAARATAHAVIGRHAHCDLALGDDPNVSLRHALLSVWREGAADVRLRLRDLGTRLRFADEAGHVCEGLSAEGLLFVQIGHYRVFCFGTGSAALPTDPWTAGARDAWACLPERVYLDARVPARSSDAALSPPSAPAATELPAAASSTTVEILESCRWLVPGSSASSGDLASAAGLLLVERATGQPLQIAVRGSDLARGLLIGRYPRCQLGASARNLSRVHLALVADGGKAWAVDIASRNGTTRAGALIRSTRLEPGAELVLARSLTLRWQPASDAATGRPDSGATEGEAT